MQPTKPELSNAAPVLDHAAPVLDHAAIDALIRKHSRRLHSFVRRRIGNPADVEEVVQETCLEAVRCLDRFQGQSRPETWLFGIAMNLVRNHYKTTKAHDIFDFMDDEDMPQVAVETRSTRSNASRHCRASVS